MSWVTTAQDGVMLQLRVAARSSRNEIVGPVGKELKVRLQAAPVDGKANKALIKLLAKTLRIPARSIEIKSGHNSRHKRIMIAGITANSCRTALTAP